MIGTQKKSDAEGREQFSSERQVLAEEKKQYVQEFNDKIANRPKSCKAWWRYDRELMNREAMFSLIPSSGRMAIGFPIRK